MAKAKKAIGKKKLSKPEKGYVTVKSKSYGKDLIGVKIYYEGGRPNGLKRDGTIKFGKNILELLGRTFKKFKWIITKEKDSITLRADVYSVRTSQKTLSRMNSLTYSRTRDIKNDIIKLTFSKKYVGTFTYTKAEKYKSGKFAEYLKEDIISALSKEDVAAINKFIPQYVAAESAASINTLKAATQIKTLKEVANEMREEFNSSRSESWWQTYIRKNILIIQQGFIKAIDKLNVSLGGTKYPDFVLVTHDGFLDILEIKKPTTLLIRKDRSRDNYYWETEISKAIIQTENYIEQVSKNADQIRSHIKDNHNIDLKVVRPRGIILAGMSEIFEIQKAKDDFRLLTQANKNITFVTYDELATRLENYIEVLEEHSKPTVSTNS